VSKSHTVSGATGTATAGSASSAGASGKTSAATATRSPNNQLAGFVLTAAAVVAGFALV